MLSPLRNRFGIPGVISVVALVFAMLGGAYAAQSSDDGKATASAKAKRGPKGPKGATGPAGPAGPAGPQGPAGANGKDGSNGTAGATGATGATGANGTSVTNTTLFDDDPICPNGGAKFTVGAGAPTYACSGEDGEGGGGGGGLPTILGTGETETGTYSWIGNGEGFQVLTSISFPIPLSEEDAEDIVVHFTDEDGDATCTGTVNKPTAPVGFFCRYYGPESNTLENFVRAPGLDAIGVGTSGAHIVGEAVSPTAVQWGSWAVTAP